MTKDSQHSFSKKEIAHLYSSLEKFSSEEVFKLRYEIFSHPAIEHLNDPQKQKLNEKLIAGAFGDHELIHLSHITKLHHPQEDLESIFSVYKDYKEKLDPILNFYLLGLSPEQISQLSEEFLNKNRDIIFSPEVQKFLSEKQVNALSEVLYSPFTETFNHASNQPKKILSSNQLEDFERLYTAQENLGNLHTTSTPGDPNSEATSKSKKI